MAGLKARIVEEITSYLITFAYLAVFFAVFAWHRRLILEEQQVPITDYWVPIIEAAVLAKVILIVDLLRVSRQFEMKPLIVPTLYKSALFGVAIAIFLVLEQTVRGLFQHHGLMGGINAIFGEGRYEVLSRCLVKFFALIPFFAFREIGRAMGPGSLTAMFLKSSAPRDRENREGRAV